MKVENMAGHTQSVVNNGSAKNRLENGAKAAENGKMKNGSINAANLNLFDDEIANRKQKAVQDALKFVKDQFEADGIVDDALDTFRERAAESRESLKEVQGELKGLEEEKEQMKEACGGEDTEEYKTYLKEQYGVRRGDLEERREKALSNISAQANTIRSVKKEMVKNQGMIDANNAKEAILDASGKEIAGMLVEEAKEKIDETVEDAVEKGEEKKEEAEEIEGKLEKIQAEQKKKAADAEQHSDEAQNKSNNSINMDRLYEAIKKNSSQILEDQNLLPEDLKGAIVDEIF